jgi:Phage protein D
MEGSFMSRQASLKLIFNGTDITTDITADLLSFTYNDNASGSSDDIMLELKDDTGKWISSWAPSKGDIIQPAIVTENWGQEGDSQSIQCGLFIIDEPSYSGRPRVLSLGAVSAPIDKGFMDVPKSHTWRNATVQNIAQTIVTTYKNENSQFSLDFLSSLNPVIGFVEQSEQTDAAFLFDLCRKNGLAMKIFQKKIIIFSEKEYENRDSTATLTESDLIGWSVKSSLNHTGFAGCQIAYTVPDTGNTLSYIYRPAGKTGSKIFRMNETLNNPAEAERYAQSKLRELNKKEYVLNLEMPGNPAMIPTNVVTVEDLGIFNGRYYIDKVSHKIGSGFTTSLELHQCLAGY